MDNRGSWRIQGIPKILNYYWHAGSIQLICEDIGKDDQTLGSALVKSWADVFIGARYSKELSNKNGMHQDQEILD